MILSISDRCDSCPPFLSNHLKSRRKFNQNQLIHFPSHLSKGSLPNWQVSRSPSLQVSKSPGLQAGLLFVFPFNWKQKNKHTTSTQWNMNHESESEILFLNCVFDVLWEQFQWDYQISSQCSKVSWLSSSLTSNNFVKSPAGLFYWSPRPCWPRSSSWMSRLVPSCTGTPQTITYHTYAVCSLFELQTS